jgi:hypothetical protein
MVWHVVVVVVVVLADIKRRGMQHSACMEEFDDVEAFLVSSLASGKA